LFFKGVRNKKYSGAKIILRRKIKTVSEICFLRVLISAEKKLKILDFFLKFIYYIVVVLLKFFFLDVKKVSF